MSSYKEKIEVLEARALELEESNSELKDAVDTGAAYVVFERSVRALIFENITVSLLHVTAHSRVTSILRITHYYHRM